jgi:beta-lactamase class A
MLLALRKRPTAKNFFILACVAILFVFAATKIYNYYAHDICISLYTYVSGIVVCGPPDIISKADYEGLRVSISSYITSQEASGSVKDVAVYFRDLVHGPTFGINALENYAPASLLKLPLALAYMNVVDTYPGLLEKKIGYTGTTTQTLEQTFTPAVSIESGRFYSIRDMIFNMLVYSDNKSYTVLGNYFENDIPNGNQSLYQAYQDLGILAPQETLDQNISVHSYASIFRSLYNASYLDPKPSEEILSWLTQSTFKLGLVAGVPQSIKVAHKFGEFTFPDNSHQLHDCGIIYYPGNPYLLCIMTKGTDWNALEKTIQTISTMTYTEVDSRKL